MIDSFLKHTKAIYLLLNLFQIRASCNAEDVFVFNWKATTRDRLTVLWAVFMCIVSDLRGCEVSEPSPYSARDLKIILTEIVILGS